jgi:hypothetical protein
MECFWLCDACLCAQAYEDCSTLSLYDTLDEVQHRRATMPQGLLRLLPISADYDPEAGWGIDVNSILLCEGCGSTLPGRRHRFTRL